LFWADFGVMKSFVLFSMLPDAVPAAKLIVGRGKAVNQIKIVLVDRKEMYDETSAI
jgi:hypothetical protein